jgi:glycogen synthase
VSRILWVAPFHAPEVGGVERLGSSVLPRLREEGHTFEVLCALGAEHRGDRATPVSEEIDGVRVHRAAFGEALATRGPARVLELRRWVAQVERAFAPDVVHQHDVSTAWWFHHSAGATRDTPMILTLHTDVASSADRLPWVRQALGSADWVTAVTDDALARMVALEPAIASRSSVVTNGVELGPEPGPPATPPVVLCPARYVHQKNLPRAIEAFEFVHERHPAARLVLVGGGALHHDLRIQADAAGLGDVIEVLGAQPLEEMPRWFARASVVAMPSHYEGLPLAALEAMAGGRPVVASMAPGFDTIVLDGVTGVRVPADDALALADALSGLLDEPARAAALGAAGRALVARSFTVDACAAGYADLYRGLAG